MLAFVDILRVHCAELNVGKVAISTECVQPRARWICFATGAATGQMTQRCKLDLGVLCSCGCAQGFSHESCLVYLHLLTRTSQLALANLHLSESHDILAQVILECD